jgi:hypothetical protein
VTDQRPTSSESTNDASTAGLDLTSPVLWAFLGEFPAAGLVLEAWLDDGRPRHATGQPARPEPG